MQITNKPSPLLVIPFDKYQNGPNIKAIQLHPSLVQFSKQYPPFIANAEQCASGASRGARPHKRHLEHLNFIPRPLRSRLQAHR